MDTLHKIGLRLLFWLACHLLGELTEGEEEELERIRTQLSIHRETT